jgi:siroheme synthase-like protein
VLPVGLRLDGLLCLVTGSGEELERRATALADAGARVRVVSERPTPAVAEAARSGRFELLQRAFEGADLDGVWLAVLTDRDPELAGRLRDETWNRRVFFAAIDQPEFCTFSHLALARSGHVTVAVSTNGRAPALARRLREELERVLQASPIAAFVERLSELRSRTPSADRARVLGEAVREVRLTGELVVPEEPKEPV